MKTVRKSKTRQLVKGIVKQAHRAVSAGAKEAIEVMDRLVPVDQADLKSTLSSNDNRKGYAYVTAGGESQISEKYVDYAPDVEFGTDHETAEGSYHIPAQPFFRSGADAGKRKMKSEMKIAE